MDASVAHRAVIALAPRALARNERSGLDVSNAEGIDTTVEGGSLMLQLIGALAEFERALIAERMKIGLTAARTRGVCIGRKRVMSAEQLRHARNLLEAGERPTDIARTMHVGRSTLYRPFDTVKSEAA